MRNSPSSCCWWPTISPAAPCCAPSRRAATVAATVGSVSSTRRRYWRFLPPSSWLSASPSESPRGAWSPHGYDRVLLHADFPVDLLRPPTPGGNRETTWRPDRHEALRRRTGVRRDRRPAPAQAPARAACLPAGRTAALAGSPGHRTEPAAGAFPGRPDRG